MRARADLLREALAASEKLRDERRDREAEAAAALARAEVGSGVRAPRGRRGHGAARRAAGSPGGSRIRDRAGRRASRVQPPRGHGPGRAPGRDRARRPRLLGRAGPGVAGPRGARGASGADASPKRAPARWPARKPTARLPRPRPPVSPWSGTSRKRATQALAPAGERVADAERPARDGPGRRARRGVVSRLDRRAPERRSPKSWPRASARRPKRRRKPRACSAAAQAASEAVAAGGAGARARRVRDGGSRGGARRGPRGGRGARASAGGASRDAARARDRVDEVREALRGAGLSEHGALSDRIRPRAGWEDAVGLVLGSDSDALLASGDVMRADRGHAAALGRAHRARRLATAHAPDRRRGRLGWNDVLDGYASLSAAGERGAAADGLRRRPARRARAVRAPPGHDVRDARGTRSCAARSCASSGASAEASGLFALRREEEVLARTLREAKATRPARERRLEELRAERAAARGRAAPAARGRARGAGGAPGVRRAARRTPGRARSPPPRERDVWPPSARRSPRGGGEPRRRRRGLAEEERRQAGRRGRGAPPHGALSVLARGGAHGRHVRRRGAGPPPDRGRGRGRAPARHWKRPATCCARRARRSSDGSPRRRKKRRACTARAAELALEETEARARQTRQPRCARDAGLRARRRRRGGAGGRRARGRGGGGRARRTARNSGCGARSALRGRGLATRSASDLEHLVTQAREEFGAEPESLEPPADTSAEALAALEAEVAELAASIERLGPVNVLAFEEHKEMSERLDVPDDAARRPPQVDRRAAGVDPQDQRDVLRTVRRGVPRDQRELQGRCSSASSRAARPR